jgi:hypothetical protein
VAGSWRRLHNEEFHNLYASPHTIWVIKSRNMKRGGHVARMGEMKMHTIFLFENLKGRDHSEDSGVDGKITLKVIIRK